MPLQYITMLTCESPAVVEVANTRKAGGLLKNALEV